jgi:PAS domain S-box-containing protein
MATELPAVGAAYASAIIEVALDSIVSMDHQGLVTEFNPAAQRTFGYSRTEAIGRPLADLIIPPTLREAHRQGIEHYLRTGHGPMLGKRIELTAMRSDGTEFPVELAICRIPASDPPSFTGFIRDLTESRRAADALRSAEERGRRYEAELAVRNDLQRAHARTREAEQLRDRLISMLEATPDFVGFADAHTAQVLYVNAAGREMCGVPSEEDITKLHISDFHPPWANERLRAEVLPAATKSGTWSGEISFLHRDGHEIPTLMLLMCHRGQTGDVEIFSTISRDISDRKQADEVARRLLQEQGARAAAEDAVRVRDDFVATAGHELKTPLAALLMNTQNIERAARFGRLSNLNERLEKLTRSALRLEKLINQLLDVSRITASRLRLEPERFDLAALVGEVVARFIDETPLANSPISIRGCEHIEGYWDRSRIDQVLTNLLSNAIKYGQEKPIDVELAVEDGSAVVRVTDRGIGIAPEHRTKLFQRFERAVSAREYGGFGLGLWITRQIIQASGGTIDVQSQPSRGSTFTFRLPLDAERQARPS